jgi:hypothetical protein
MGRRMTPQEREVYALLKYAAGKLPRNSYVNNACVSEPRADEFYTRNVLFIDIPQWLARSNRTITLNFAKKTVRWWASDFSYHNSDIYNVIDGDVDWDSFLPQAYETLLKVVKEQLYEEVRAEESKKLEDMYKSKAEARLEEMLNGAIQ